MTPTPKPTEELLAITEGEVAQEYHNETPMFDEYSQHVRDLQDTKPGDQLIYTTGKFRFTVDGREVIITATKDKPVVINIRGESNVDVINADLKREVNRVVLKADPPPRPIQRGPLEIKQPNLSTQDRRKRRRKLQQKRARA